MATTLWKFPRISPNLVDNAKFPGVGYKKFLAKSYEKLLGIGYKNFLGICYKKFLGMSYEKFPRMGYVKFHGMSYEKFLGMGYKISSVWVTRNSSELVLIYSCKIITKISIPCHCMLFIPGISQSLESFPQNSCKISNFCRHFYWIFRERFLWISVDFGEIFLGIFADFPQNCYLITDLQKLNATYLCQQNDKLKLKKNYFTTTISFVVFSTSLTKQNYRFSKKWKGFIPIYGMGFAQFKSTWKLVVPSSYVLLL